ALAALEACDIGAERFDRTGRLEPEDRRISGRRRIVSLALDSVRAVDARRVDADQNAARTDGRSFDVAGFQDLGSAEPVEDNCLHRASFAAARSDVRACCGAGAIYILYRRPNGLPAR